jgi:hypothetical protein
MATGADFRVGRCLPQQGDIPAAGRCRGDRITLGDESHGAHRRPGITEYTCKKNDFIQVERNQLVLITGVFRWRRNVGGMAHDPPPKILSQVF